MASFKAWLSKADPRIGDRVRLSSNKFGEVVSVNGERYIVKVNGEDIEVPRSELALHKRPAKHDYDNSGSPLRGSGGSNFMAPSDNP